MLQSSHETFGVSKFKNEEKPFTELFALLKRYEILSQGFPILGYETEELKIMHQHIDNAMDMLLQGLQDVGHLIGLTASDKNMIEELNHIGFFISAITNLTEALNDLRSDTNYSLKERGVMNY